jgi:Mn2+/Fe2+ NRAMP family transporter
MKILVGVMILGFLGNLAFAQPSLTAILSGLLPSLPAGMGSSLLPARVGSDIVDPLLPVQALVGTTFSVAGAFYQAYLVRDKGWTGDDLRRGLFDSVVGISVLGCLTLTVMVTAAAVLHGKVRGSDLKSAADVALQLEPLFGGAAKLLFSVGLLAGALSSFLVNAMIGGAVLSDGLGFGGQMDRRGPKLCTAIALLVGMAVAMAMQASEWSPLQLVYFAQAMTVVGNPVLALVLLWLSRAAGTPRWIQVVAGLGLLLVLFLAVRTGLTLYFKCFGAG